MGAFDLPGIGRLVQANSMDHGRGTGRPFRAQTRARRARWSLGLALSTLLALAGAEVARAQDGRDEIERWVPALGVSFDALGQKMRGRVATGPVLGPPLSGVDAATGTPFMGCDLAPEQGVADPATTYDPKQDGGGNPLLCDSARGMPGVVGLPDSSSDTSAEPMVTGTLELMSPALLDRFLRPRLFAHADLAGAFTFDRNLAGTGAPGSFSAPETASTVNRDQEEVGIEGQGSRVTARGGDLVVSGGAGVAFTLDALGRRFRIKPSVEYIRRELELEGRVHRAVKLTENRGFGLGADKDSLLDFRLVQLRASDTVVYHGIGPGLEVEVDTQRIGPILFSVYAQGRGYYFPGDLEETLTATNEFGERATFDYEFDSWAWRGGAGIRFRFVPE